MFPKKIVCPLDYSSASFKALQYAGELAHRAGARLHLFHACHIPLPSPENNMFDSNLLVAETEDSARTKIEDMLATVFGDEIPFTYHIHIKYGFAVEGITQLVREVDADLVVMYTTGADTILDAVLGTISVEVFEQVDCPVLILPDEWTPTLPKKVVYATDLEVDASYAVERVIALASFHHAHISFVSIKKENTDFTAKDIQTGVQKYVHTFPYDAISFHLQENDSIVEGIEIFAAEQKADLVVMTMHQRTFLERIFSASKTKKMLQYATVPVLAFKMDY
ncbi:MAG: universal stress protein [Cytophagaceae bacterium]|jgi:nucleotide-binding universal stress UspA family protein|nr:universal stress protein [Cytophagaceae bacterium]